MSVNLAHGLVLTQGRSWLSTSRVHTVLDTGGHINPLKPYIGGPFSFWLQFFSYSYTHAETARLHVYGVHS